jgi:zinc protease
MKTIFKTFNFLLISLTLTYFQANAQATAPAKKELKAEEKLESLSNGSPFFGSEDKSLPRSIYLFSFQGGPKRFPAEKQGIVSVLLELYNDGPKDLSVKAYNQQLFELGAEINYSSGANGFEVIVKTLPANQAKVFELVRRTLKNPRSEKFDFEKAHASILASLKAKFENMRAVIYYFAPLDLMSYNPLILAGQTSPTSFAKITYKEVKENLSSLATFDTLFVSYIGADPVSSAKALVNTVFAEDLKKTYVRPAIERTPIVKIEGLKYTVIDKPGATDNQFLIFYPQSVKRDSAEWLQAKMTMDLLGGGLHGALGKTLRVERGLTYGAQSAFNNQGWPYWYIWTFGGVEQTKGLLQGIPEVTEKYQKATLTPALLAESKARVLNDFKSSTELPQDLLIQKSWYYHNAYDATFLSRYENELKNISLSQVAGFRKSLQTKNAAIYLMGDQKVLLPILQSLGVESKLVRVVTLSEIK